MPHRDELARMGANMRTFYRVLGERSPGGAVFEREGLLAAMVPACPRLSIVNGVVYDSADALVAARDELEAAYAGAGVKAWTVWVPEDDRAVAERLERAGHRLDASPRAMILDLGDVELDGPGEVDWERTSDADTVGEINEVAYGLPAGAFAPSVTALAGDPVVLYLARVDGEPAACVGALDEGGDCGIYVVATRPEAQGRGLASALMRQAILDARSRGCETSSLQATKAGAPVYRRLGYRDVCAIDMWEHRERAHEPSR
jgi:GNAT superfamily N-acetyltransferase